MKEGKDLGSTFMREQAGNTMSPALLEKAELAPGTGSRRIVLVLDLGQPQGRQFLSELLQRYTAMKSKAGVDMALVSDAQKEINVGAQAVLMGAAGTTRMLPWLAEWLRDGEKASFVDKTRLRNDAVVKIARIAYGIAASISRSSLYFTIRARSPISTGLRHGLSATIASENGPLGFSQSGFLAAARRCPTGWWRRRYPVHPYPPNPAQSTDDGHDDDPPLIAIFERKEPEWLATRPDDTCPSAQLQAASLRKPDRGRAGQCNGALGDEIGWHMRDFALLYGSTVNSVAEQRLPIGFRLGRLERAVPALVVHEDQREPVDSRLDGHPGVLVDGEDALAKRCLAHHARSACEGAACGSCNSDRRVRERILVRLDPRQLLLCGGGHGGRQANSQGTPPKNGGLNKLKTTRILRLVVAEDPVRN